MLKKILSEESSPIVISGDGEKIMIPRLTDNDQIYIGPDWKISSTWEDEPGRETIYSLPLTPGDYSGEELMIACIMYLRLILHDDEDSVDDKYVIYEILADTDKKIISFEIEVLDDSNEVEFDFENNNNNIKDLMNYESGRIIKVEK